MTPRRCAAPAGKTCALLRLLLAIVLLAAPASAQDELEDVFGGMGTAKAVDETAPPAGQRPGEGSIRGRVFHAESGAPVRGVTVIVAWPAPADGSEPRQEVQVTDADGAFEFASIPPGEYSITYLKAGYRASTMTGFQVVAGQVQVADFPLPPLATAASNDVLELEPFVVEQSTVAEMMTALELRMDSDALLNVMSAEEFSKFAASDVAEAIKRVAGVNVVEGQFAIIRGLEDRYSSTLYNNAVIPSPDPDRQSVQLDLFPSEVVGNLIVTKTFEPGLPSNSAGGSIDIVTTSYPEDFELKVKAKTGFNDNAIDHFLGYQKGSPVGKEEDGTDVLASEFGGSFGGRFELLDREIRYKAVGNYETDFDTAQGWQEGREPRNAFVEDGPTGDLADGNLFLSDGHFDLTTSGKDVQTTGYGAFGFDLDPAGNHKIDASVLWTQKDGRAVQLKENGYWPNQDYTRAIEKELEGRDVTFNDFNGSRRPNRAATGTSWIGKSIRPNTAENPDRGAAWFASFLESKSFKRNRDLLVPQINGDHTIGAVPGLHFSWAGNYAKTTQKEDALGARMFYEPCGFGSVARLQCPEGVNRIDVPTEFPVTVESLGPGQYVAGSDLFQNSNDIEEKQWFGRLDGDYEASPLGWLDFEVRTGGWYEDAKRDVTSRYLPSNKPRVNPTCKAEGNCTGNGSQLAIFGDTLEELGQRIFNEGLLRDEDGIVSGLLENQNDSKRRIWAWHFGGKLTLWDDLDLLGGFRLEQIRIESNNNPFTGSTAFDLSPEIFPSKWLMFDVMDNPTRNEVRRAPPYNYEILGLDVEPGPCRNLAGNEIPNGGECIDLIDQAEIEKFVNGKIDKLKVLPSVGLAYRPLAGLTLRGAYSQTVARPSFREMGYYVSVEPASDDLIVGNPQLGLSNVDSWDARAEYLFGESGDLFAFSGFYKTIDDPIESIIIRDAAIFEDTSRALYRTFFNNPNQATLWGIEVEGRKHFDFVGLEFAKYLSVGGNFTWIEAEVKRTEAELTRSEIFFFRRPEDAETNVVQFPKYKKTRRLFGQPKWIGNADVTFDQPDWGTRATLAYFAISDVLDAAGSANIGQDGTIRSFALDRYVDSYYQLDLVLTQKIWGGLTFKFSAKNLTDSVRRIAYDPAQTKGKFTERAVRLGRDFKFELSYTFSPFEL